MCGGPSAAKAADDDGRKILDTVKHTVLEKANAEGEGKREYHVLTDLYLLLQIVVLHSYKTQVVAGTNYFMKLIIGDKVVHARVFAPLPHTGQPAELHSIEHGDHVTHESEINYF